MKGLVQMKTFLKNVKTFFNGVSLF